MTRDRMRGRSGPIAAALLAAGVPAQAQAEMVLSKVIVDLRGGQPASDDIEVWNDGAERLYVVAEPSQIVAPGTVSEHREAITDPSRAGLLVSPQRLIVEPGQRRRLRVATVIPAGERDRVYRVTIKPVAGALVATSDAVKVFVGYDVLAIQRPAAIVGTVRAERKGKSLKLVNASNTAWELFEGSQCDPEGRACITLPATRLYAGAEWTVALRYDTEVVFKRTNGEESAVETF